MNLPILVYCPYCGDPQSEEFGLTNLLQNDVFMLSCTKCKKDCVLVLYDDIQSSASEPTEAS